MNNFSFLKKYQRLQDGIMYDKLIDLSFATVSYCDIYDSEFWNNALTGQVLEEDQLSKIEKILKEWDRKSTVYFENKSELELLKKLLVSRGYRKSFEDSWQFWKGGNIEEKYFDNVQKVINEGQLKVFLQTFDRCYQKDDPQNPYGELGDYLKVSEQSWHKHWETNRLEYFISYKNEEPVAVSTLTNFDDLGYISNVGSLPEVRGKGFGKAATLYCVKQSIKNGNKEHCLATEEGHYPNEFYKRIGFDTRFNAVAYTRHE
jgi:ribosomal protein S18 acetylase RimI-like enzyme